MFGTPGFRCAVFLIPEKAERQSRRAGHSVRPENRTERFYMRRILTDGFRKAAAAFAAVMLISAAWAGVSESHAGVVGKGNGGSAGSTASFTIPEFTPRATAQKSGGYYFNGSGMYTFEQLGADLAALNGRTGYRYSSIGKTPDGRDIWQVVLGDPSASKKILVVGTMHGREYITTPLIRLLLTGGLPVSRGRSPRAFPADRRRKRMSGSCCPRSLRSAARPIRRRPRRIPYTGS